MQCGRSHIPHGNSANWRVVEKGREGEGRHRPWAMGHGLWAMGYGLWAVGRQGKRHTSPDPFLLLLCRLHRGSIVSDLPIPCICKIAVMAYRAQTMPISALRLSDSARGTPACWGHSQGRAEEAGVVCRLLYCDFSFTFVTSTNTIQVQAAIATVTVHYVLHDAATLETTTAAMTRMFSIAKSLPLTIPISTSLV